MAYTGKVKNGVVVLAADVQLPENTLVSVELINADASQDPLLEAVEKVAKPRPHWPDDYALNHGHYVSGEPRK